MIFLNLIQQLEYTLLALYKYISANIWKFIIWTFTVFLLPTYQFIFIILILLIIDLITGIWKSLKQGHPITSKKLGDTIKKIIWYNVAIISAYLVQHVIALEAVKLMWFLAVLISVKEFKSIIENIEIITNTKLWDFLIRHITELFPEAKDLEKKDKSEK